MAPDFDAPKKPNRRRDAKDARYGFGGRKRGSRKNDGTSAADMSSFSVGRNNADVKKAQFGRKKKSAKRPGKSRRQTTRR
jgi:rRNA-processing protein EBP2